MANDRQYKHTTRFVATRGVKEYRESIAQWVTPDDCVLEIGCEWGTTTSLIAARAPDVVGTDISEDCIQRARVMRPDLRFEILDAFDIRTAMSFGKPFSKVYIDMSGISGYRSLLDLIALLNLYAAVFSPRAIVVKSGALKHFASQCVAWNSHGLTPRPGSPVPPPDPAEC
jgi:hypothetical protein